ncbi:DUF1549 domain-containing protein [Stieleria tagensis]|uniref:DUF1549 domain-containing protein n=1 Tax=Stieleria tagensis TaxID=2956795 RepID=UPI00209AA9A5|nr:DUF1549 domain-containing protein [Stieleria tagensis]
MIQGTDLNDSLRLTSSDLSADWKISNIEPTQATVALTLSEDAPLGPMSLWLATATGAVKPHTLFVDDLDAVDDSGNNHSLATAQQLSSQSTVEGVCDASASDFYRIHVTGGQRIAVEVHTQQLRSAMDPVLRLLNAAGETLVQVDDTSVGPDCRFSYEFAEEGDYWIEIHDSRNSAGGALYQLRIGDFPIIDQSYPLATRSGETTEISFTGPDAEHLPAREIQVPAEDRGTIHVQARFDNGKSSSWVPLYHSPAPQIAETASNDCLTLPIGINGRLQQPGEVDSYLIRGAKGQVARFAAKTRSLGSPSLLQMQLFDAAGAKIAETKVTDADEWSFDATFSDDGDYRLEVTDLLKRGGNRFSYYIQCALSGTFTVALKADASAREEFMIEPGHGACALDLQISRFGYDGEIDLALTNPESGVRILNPRIPAKVVAAKIYLTANESWTTDSLDALRISATSVDNPEQGCFVDSHALRRVKEPFVLAPTARADGTIVLAATTTTAAPFTMEPTAPVQFARPVRSHSAVLTPKRLQDKFKTGVDVLPSSLPVGWNASTKVDKETHTLTLTRSEQATGEPEHLPLLVYGDFNGHGRIETYHLPIQWIDPVRVTTNFAEPFVRGGRVRTEVHLHREGSDPQPVVITLASLPSGITGPESITIAADQTQAEFELQIAGDADLDVDHELALSASSKFTGQDFTVTSKHPLPTLADNPANLVVYPSEIIFTDSRSRQQLAVTGTNRQGLPHDWSRHARLTSSNPQIAEVRDGVVYPIADGETEVIVEIGSNRHVIPTRVSNMATPRKIEFESEVLVALSKQGCNSGACHGSPSGKGGFRLSLRAFDMKLDQLTLIREDFGRRTNPIDPEQSLLLLKPLMKVAHGGGKQLHTDDAAYKILRDWIASGATADPVDSARITKLEVYPSQKQILAVKDGGQQLAVTAHFADGRQRDVTHLVAYETSDSSVATVDVNGFVTPHARGEVAILVRLLEYIESVPLMFVENSDDFEWKSPQPNNYIDELVNAKLQQLQYLPADTCSDDEFLRRVSLDLLGILPTIDETTAFLADTGEDKRERLVDALLQREEYAKFWALKWGDLLKMTSKLVGDEGVYKYHRWVEQSLHENMPYDEFAKQLLTGAGSTLANPPANFYRTSTDMNECVETISQVFLGARLQCAKCHNHPFERWTQDNYYGLGAFFNRVQRRNTERPGEMFVYTSFTGDVTQPRTGQIMAPWLPQVGSIESPNDTDRRTAFAEWLVNPDNPYFARIEANRIWSQLFERGIVDPIDDFRDSNPPSNATLLDALAKDFVESGYDRKRLLRVILNSRTYQASYQTTEYNQDDSKYFSHQAPRLLGAEQLLDAINRTLELEQKFGSLPAGTLATQLPAPDVVKIDFLKVFGQPERSTVCACERADDSTLGMAIELFNGPMIHEKLRAANNRFRKSLATGKGVEEVVSEIYLAAVCRPPSEIELKAALEHCSKNPDPVVGVEDVCWALFNTDEFLFQH